MPADRARRRATYEDLCAVPAHLVAELVAGELHTSPRPAMRQASTTSLLGAELLGPFWHGRGGPGGWIILDEPELHLAEDVVVPDLAGWRRTRLPEVPDTDAIELAPDWVAEVVSPATEVLDRRDKLPIYAREGVGHAWLLDPLERTLETYAVHRGVLRPTAVHRDAARVRAEPFDAIQLDFAVLFSR